jgi:hypothetical protein
VSARREEEGERGTPTSSAHMRGKHMGAACVFTSTSGKLLEAGSCLACPHRMSSLLLLLEEEEEKEEGKGPS